MSKVTESQFLARLEMWLAEQYESDGIEWELSHYGPTMVDAAYRTGDGFTIKLHIAKIKHSASQLGRYKQII